MTRLSLRVAEMLLSLILTYCIIIVQNEGGNNTMRIKRLAATLLLTATVFSIAAGSTTAMAASATDLYDEILANNKEFIEFHDNETIGLPLEISEEARKLSNEIVGDETDPYKKARLIYDWMSEHSTYGSMPMTTYYEEGYTGNCHTFAREFQKMCWAQNIPCVYYSGKAYNPYTLEPADHAWNAFFADGEWHLVDVTGGVTGANRQVFFDASIEQATQPYATANLKEFWNIENREKVNAWAADDVTQAFAYGLIPYTCIDDWNNSLTKTICTDNCSRKSFAQMAVALLEAYYGKGIDEILTEKGATIGSFTDTDDPAVLAANALGIVNGYGNGTFGPENSITRQEAAAILARTAQVLELPQNGADLSAFTDHSQIGTWARESVAVCKELGVMQGTSDTAFSPLAPYTREQCIVTIKRLFETARG